MKCAWKSGDNMTGIVGGRGREVKGAAILILQRGTVEIAIAIGIAIESQSISTISVPTAIAMSGKMP
jgi:hypothetical protein